MKVSLFNKALWQSYSNIIGIICGPASFVLIFIDLSSNEKLIMCGISLFVFCFIFIFLFIKSNLISERVLQINGVRLVVKFGDLFSEKGLKTIAFNEYFDTIVDEKIISSNTINGIFLNEKVTRADIEELNKSIENDSKCQNSVSGYSATRLRGKNIKYVLGTSLRFKEYILVAFSKFDENDRAYLSLSEYLSCLVNYWTEVNRIYNGENVVLPLLGTGITRFKEGSVITPQDALEIIINIFKFSNLSFKQGFQITLVIHQDLRSEINLYNLGRA